MLTSTNSLLIEIYDILYSAFGPQNWWPAETELEMMVGAILTQNTNWKNVEKAIGNLKDKDILTINRLMEIPDSMLAQLIKPAGYYNIKTRRLKNLIGFIDSDYDGDIFRLFSLDIQEIRKELLSVNGVGLETADSIVLYGAGKPLFVVDTYTHRILTRHGMIEEEAGYNDLQSLFMDNLPHDEELFKEFHALIVRSGKEYCKKKPLCQNCPLKNFRSR